MKTKDIVFTLIGCVLLCSCQVMERKHKEGAAVEVNGKYLYRATIDSLTLGLSSEDSLRVAQQYISQWAKDILMYDRAKAKNNKEIERLVEDYRRSLYIHAYEEHLVDKRMSKTVLDSTVQQMYGRMPDRFRLDESIMKGVLLVIPTDAPESKKLRQWLSQIKKEDEFSAKAMDNIEKYAYQNASKYELFVDKWLTTSDIINHMPMERSFLESQIKIRNQIEVKDSTNTYLLQLTDKHMRGEQMPVDYARPQIEKIILNARQVEFLTKEREKLYDEAIQDKKIIFYE